MDLSKMFPKRASFKVKALSATFELKPLTVEGEIWITREYGEEFIENLSKMDLLMGTRLAYYLINDEDKTKYFVKEDKIVVNEEGEQETVKAGGVALLQASLAGQEEQIEMFNAIFQTIINSRPELSEKKKKKMMKEAEKEKKNQKKQKK